jgi:hypothetical protein
MAGAAVSPSQAQIALAIAIVNSKPTNAAIAGPYASHRLVTSS